MKILVLGYGYIGSIVARDLAGNMPSDDVVIAGRSRSRAEQVATAIGKKNVSWLQLDASNRKEVVNALKDFDLMVGALPGEVGFQSIKACVDAKVNAVDVSFMPENPLTLSKDAIKAGVTIIPDCGVAPGLSNMLVNRAISKLDQAKNVKIMVGGLPEKPIPPLGYTITWSVEGVIDEYMRKAKIVKDGKVTEVEALSGLEDVELPGVGKLEAFWTDGLRTLLQTVKGVENMWEKTLRYPGHIDRIKLLRTLGFFDEKPIEVEGVSIPPRQITAKLLERKLWRSDVPDILTMLVQVDGNQDGRRIMYSYYMLDRYDKKTKVTAMSRTTGYTTSCVAQLLAKKAIKEKGITPPEKLGGDESTFKKLIGMLKKRGIQVKESKKTLR
jgi:lysine 6-dehydrogenase